MIQRVTIPISGPIPGGKLDRGSLERLQKSLEAVAGVLSVFVSSQTEMAYVTFNPNEVDLRALRSAIEREGFRTARFIASSGIDRRAEL